jgi:hypothetical protein
MTATLRRAIDIASKVFRGMPSFEDVRLPRPTDQSIPHQNWLASALWTKDGLRPRWQRLAAIVCALSDLSDLELWRKVLADLAIPLGIMPLRDRCIVITRLPSKQTVVKEVPFDALAGELGQYRDMLFSPRALSRFRSGQLSFADLEEDISEDGFTLLLRHRAQLDKALGDGIKGALETHLNKPRAVRSLAKSLSYFESVLVVTVAYVGARILEDKGFFGSTHEIASDPEALLKKTLTKTDGFFHRAVDEELCNLDLESVQQLALHLGPSVAFSLVDHHDVGRLYEKAQGILQGILEQFLKSIEKSSAEVRGLRRTRARLLQQHYTPIAVADEMLRHLPLERIHPDERFVLDPAAGSGSLLLAATKRLASLDDTPTDIGMRDYLTSHLAGNDIDSLAGLVIRLRFSLDQESLGSTELFPVPSVFERDFRDLTKETLPIKARVVIANPPFAEEGNVQKAAQFVELALNWLSERDQFAFVLPGGFMTDSSHGIAESRRQLTRRCKIFESWRFPEGVVGLTARQNACVVIGEVGKSTIPRHSVGRVVLSSAKKEAIRDEGFLGQSWIAGDPIDEDWRALVAPGVELDVDTKPLGRLFRFVTGVTRDKNFQPLDEKPSGVKVKPYWQWRYKGRGRVWADPEKVKKGRYLRYGEQYLEGPRLEYEAAFDWPKLLVGRSVNVNAIEPLAACLDTTGLCPDNHVFCIWTTESIGGTIEPSDTPVGWSQLDNDSRLLWLLGVLNSEVAVDLSLPLRDSRQITEALLAEFALPATIDPRILQVARQMVERDKRRTAIPNPDALRQRLNDLVEESYGNPRRLKLVRTGALPDLGSWKSERWKTAFTVIGRVLECSPVQRRILIRLNGLSDDEQERWLPYLPHLPGWALDGTVFQAQISDDIRTFDDLAARPWALRGVEHTPCPYASIEELEAQLYA